MNHGRIGVNGTVARTRTGNHTGSLTAGIERGDGRTDVVGSTAHDWKTDYGRIGVALSGHLGRTDKVTDLGAIAALGGAHRVLFETGHHHAGAAGGGVTVGMIGGRVTGRAGKFEHAAYITHLDPATAGAAVDEPAKGKIPDLQDPLALNEHDVLMLYRSGDLGISADITFAGVSVTGRKSVRGDFRFIVERLAGDKIRLTVTPEKVDTLGVGGRVLIAEGGVDKDVSDALTQVYEIDLTTTAGIAAYKAALEGELPTLKAIDALAAANANVDTVDDANRELPEGLTALALETRTARSVTNRIGLTWAFFGRESSTRTTTSETVRAEDGRVVSDRSSERERVRETWFSGVERRGVYASVSHETVEGEGDAEPTSQFKGIRFGAHYEDARTKGDELEAICALMSEVFGFDWKTEGLRGYGEHRRVEVELGLEPPMLAALSGRQLDALEDAASAVKLDRRPVRALVKRLKQNSGAAERADAIQTFVADQGMKGLGVLVRAFSHIAPRITADTRAYDEIVTSFDAVRSALEGKAIGGASEFAERYERCMRSKREIDIYRTVLVDDPLLDDPTRTRLLSAFDTALTQVEAFLDLSTIPQAQRDAMRADLASFAVVDTDHAAVRHIDAYSDRPIGAPG